MGLGQKYGITTAERFLSSQFVTVANQTTISTVPVALTSVDTPALNGQILLIDFVADTKSDAANTDVQFDMRLDGVLIRSSLWSSHSPDHYNTLTMIERIASTAAGGVVSVEWFIANGAGPTVAILYAALRTCVVTA